jgi:hypothetical protein
MPYPLRLNILTTAPSCRSRGDTEREARFVPPGGNASCLKALPRTIGAHVVSGVNFVDSGVRCQLKAAKKEQRCPTGVPA